MHWKRKKHSIVLTICRMSPSELSTLLPISISKKMWWYKATSQIVSYDVAPFFTVSYNIIASRSRSNLEWFVTLYFMGIQKRQRGEHSWKEKGYRDSSQKVLFKIKILTILTWNLRKLKFWLKELAKTSILGLFQKDCLDLDHCTEPLESEPVVCVVAKWPLVTFRFHQRRVSFWLLSAY